MKTKIIFQFTLITLAISFITLGCVAALGHHGFTQEYHPWIFILMILGGQSPAYVSFFVLWKNGEVSGLKEFMNNVLYTKNKPILYLFPVFMVALYYVAHIAVSGTSEIQPIFMIFPLALGALFAGGTESAGWRYILQPGLDQKFGFIVSAVVTGIIWVIWHIPFFFIPALPQYTMDFWMFAVNVIGMSFIFGAIIRISGKGAIFLSIIAHTLINATGGVFVFNETWPGTIVAFAVVVIASLVTVFINDKRGGAYEVTDSR